MKARHLIILLAIVTFISCNEKNDDYEINILFLHQSTGEIIWQGKEISLLTRAARRISPGLAKIITRKGKLEKHIEEYNKNNNKNYNIEEIRFPENSGNYPFHYYNLWVKNAGEQPHEGEPTLEMLTKDYQVIIFKHCYPVSNIKEDQDSADINSRLMTISNYKLQYLALKEKLHQFPSTKFILFTGAVQVKANLTVDEANRARDFFNWVRNEWDESGDNIFLWDLYSLQTEGGLYFRDEYATSPDNSHPNEKFASKVVTLLFKRIIDVIENDGEETLLTGKEE
jgi:hypothetical protein